MQSRRVWTLLFSLLGGVGLALPARSLPPIPMPAPKLIPGGQLGSLVRYGRQIITRTPATLPQHVGNRLSCTNCHLQAGTKAFAAPFIGITRVFPAYRARSGKADTLPDRINDCFERSLNGKALDPASPAMQGVLAYMLWLSQDVPQGREVIGRGFRSLEAQTTPDQGRGRQVYASRCAVCHGEDGQGDVNIPPLWGPQSFSIGAGMARLGNASAFIRENMPLGRGGTLSKQQALDVAAYVIHQERPDFAGKENDWPKGGKPPDVRY